MHFIGINHYSSTCKTSTSVDIRSDIESEGEFFQETCVENLMFMEYSNYQILKEIMAECDDFLWSS